MDSGELLKELRETSDRIVREKTQREAKEVAEREGKIRTDFKEMADEIIASLPESMREIAKFGGRRITILKWLETDSMVIRRCYAELVDRLRGLFPGFIVDVESPKRSSSNLQPEAFILYMEW